MKILCCGTPGKCTFQVCNSFLNCSALFSILGKLIRGKMHTHNAVFKESFFFAAKPNQLGLDASKFYGEKVFHTLSLKALGTIILELCFVS